MYKTKFVTYGNNEKKQDIIEYLLEQNNIDLALSDVNGKTALIYAINNKDIKLIRHIIEKSEKLSIDLVNRKDNNRCIALNYAIKTGDSDIIFLILNKTKNIDRVIDDCGRNIMHYAVVSAIKNRNMSVLRTISQELENQKSLEEMLYKVDIDYKTFLHYAAMSKNPEILDYFLEDKTLNLGIERRDIKGKRAIDYLLSDEIEQDNITKKIMRKMIMRLDDSDDVENVLYTACCNKKNPNVAVEMVLDAFTYIVDDERKPINSHRILKSLQPSITKRNQETALDKALQNENISLDVLCKLINMSGILKDKVKKNILIKKIEKYGRKDVKEKLGINKIRNILKKIIKYVSVAFVLILGIFVIKKNADVCKKISLSLRKDLISKLREKNKVKALETTKDIALECINKAKPLENGITLNI